MTAPLTQPAIAQPPSIIPVGRPGQLVIERHWRALPHPSEVDLQAASLAGKPYPFPYTRLHLTRPNRAAPFSARIERAPGGTLFLLYTYADPNRDGGEAEPLKFCGDRNVDLTFRERSTVWAVAFDLRDEGDIGRILRGHAAILADRQPSTIYRFTND